MSDNFVPKLTGGILFSLPFLRTAIIHIRIHTAISIANEAIFGTLINSAMSEYIPPIAEAAATRPSESFKFKILEDRKKHRKSILKFIKNKRST